MPDTKEKISKEKMTVYLPEELVWKMRERAVDDRISGGDTAAVEVAVAEWVGAGPTAKPKPHPNDEWHEALADVLASGHKEAISAVQQNLRVFRSIAQSKPKTTPGKSR